MVMCVLSCREIRTLAEELKNRIKNLGIIAPPLNPVSTLNAGEELTKEQTLLLKVSHFKDCCTVVLNGRLQ